MSKNLVAQAQVVIAAPPAKVWEALVTPDMIPKYMFGTNAVSQSIVGAALVWRGERQVKPDEDNDEIVQFEPERRLQYSHFSPLTGQPDVPENYHAVTVELAPSGDGTLVTLTQDKNANDEERAHSEQ